MPAVVGALFIALGLISLFKRDWMWALTKLGNDFEGQASNRNERWELGTAVGGIALVIVGVVLLFIR